MITRTSSIDTAKYHNDRYMQQMRLTWIQGSVRLTSVNATDALFHKVCLTKPPHWSGWSCCCCGSGRHCCVACTQVLLFAPQPFSWTDIDKVYSRGLIAIKHRRCTRRKLHCSNCRLVVDLCRPAKLFRPIFVTHLRRFHLFAQSMHCFSAKSVPSGLFFSPSVCFTFLCEILISAGGK